MTSTEPPNGQITCPVHLMAAVPDLLGFQPKESLLAVGFTGDRLTAAVRTGLTAVTLTGMIDTLAILQRGGATTVTGMVFSDVLTPGMPTPDDSALTVLFAALSGSTLHPRDMVIVTGNRWRSLRCADPDCCYPHGRPMPSAPNTSPAPAAADTD